jgi:hypothetical protein
LQDRGAGLPLAGFARLLLFPLLVPGGALADGVPRYDGKYVVGAVETVTVVAAGLDIRARVDTGATTCSIHAEDVELLPWPPEGRGEGSTMLSFRVRNERGESRLLRTRLVSTVVVKTAEARELRHMVRLRLRWRAVEKDVLVTLNDRSRMSYNLLLGRNWLRGSFVVDVDRDEQN